MDESGLSSDHSQIPLIIQNEYEQDMKDSCSDKLFSPVERIRYLRMGNLLLKNYGKWIRDEWTIHPIPMTCLMLSFLALIKVYIISSSFA
jgi:hypothetical protein